MIIYNSLMLIIGRSTVNNNIVIYHAIRFKRICQSRYPKAKQESWRIESALVPSILKDDGLNFYVNMALRSVFRFFPSRSSDSNKKETLQLIAICCAM